MSQEPSSLSPSTATQGQPETQDTATPQVDTATPAAQVQASTPELASSAALSDSAEQAAALSDPAEQASYRFGHIRSFVHRRAHITPGQQEAINTLMQDWAID